MLLVKSVQNFDINNIRVHGALIICFILNKRIAKLGPPPYSPDFTPSDLCEKEADFLMTTVSQPKGSTLRDNIIPKILFSDLVRWISETLLCSLNLVFLYTRSQTA